MYIQTNVQTRYYKQRKNPTFSRIFQSCLLKGQRDMPKQNGALYLLVYSCKSLQPICKWGTWNLRVPNPEISSNDLTKRLGTILVVAVIAAGGLFY